MESKGASGAIHEEVVSEILEVRQHLYRAREVRYAVAMWVRGAASVAALAILLAGLILGWLRRSDLESIEGTLWIVVGAGFCLLLLALITHGVSASYLVLMPRKWGDLVGHYRTAFPDESAEAVRREVEPGPEERREQKTEALEAILRARGGRR